MNRSTDQIIEQVAGIQAGSGFHLTDADTAAIGRVLRGQDDRLVAVVGPCSIHDRAQARAARGDEQARVQVRRLLDAIKPAVFEDITDIDPRHGYIDLALVKIGRAHV